MDKLELQRIERENNQGQASPVDVQALIARVRLLENVLADRLELDYQQADRQRKRQPRQ